MDSALQQINAQQETLLAQLLQDGLLDEQFTQLLQLQDDSNPNFVSEVVELYFEDSGSKVGWQPLWAWHMHWCLHFDFQCACPCTARVGELGRPSA